MAIYDTRNRYAIKDIRILKLINECTTNVQIWGFKLPKEITWYSAQCNNRLGLANYRTNSITLSTFLFKETDDNNIRNTIYHELGHLIAGPKAHHGYEWKKVVKVISDKTGLIISRLAKTSDYEYFQSTDYQDKYKYIFKCKHCGCTLRYQKHTNFVDTYNDTYVDTKGNKKPRWTCSCCGGTFERIK